MILSELALFGFFLAGDAMLSPRHGFQSLLLHLVLAVRTHAVLFLLNAFQRRFDHVQWSGQCWSCQTGIPWYRNSPLCRPNPPWDLRQPIGLLRRCARWSSATHRDAPV